ncbi:unnamed protein product [Hyaloperonospora brassicae]|uniref:Peptidase S1 domain-containing protein n=1 Tax=Hyaloperonospora brassicae TaxID=162125 RepID=A0AAV0U260_HYABA|nr:unnamed protein product [Hyaloperonospora brassicae]
MKFTVSSRVRVIASVLVAATCARGTALVETNGSLVLGDAALDNESTGLTISEETRIFGGAEADASQLPFIVSLRKGKADANTFCGGTLIASQFVVTAGHCVKTDESMIYASIGSAFAKGADGGQQVKVVEGYRHPLYNKSAHLYDVGVLKLEKPVAVAAIGLAAADGSDNKVGTVATVRGWGITENGSQSLMLEEVDVHIVSTDECSKQYKDRITDTMLCAGNGQGQDSCNGDSGGPLIANGKLVGVVSWGGKCGANSGVYTRVSAVRDYINDIVHGGSGVRFSAAHDEAKELDVASTDPKGSAAGRSSTVHRPSAPATREVATARGANAPSPPSTGTIARAAIEMERPVAVPLAVPSEPTPSSAGSAELLLSSPNVAPMCT